MLEEAASRVELFFRVSGEFFGGVSQGLGLKVSGFSADVCGFRLKAGRGCGKAVRPDGKDTASAPNPRSDSKRCTPENF